MKKRLEGRTRHFEPMDMTQNKDAHRQMMAIDRTYSGVAWIKAHERLLAKYAAREVVAMTYDNGLREIAIMDKDGKVISTHVSGDAKYAAPEYQYNA